MKRTIVFFLAGFVVGELDPVGWTAWQLVEKRLPEMKQRSLDSPSVFDPLPASRWIAQSDHAYVIEDQYAPTAPVHLLVVPKRRYTSLLEAPPQILGEMLDLARATARDRGIADSGFRVIINTNPQGGQTVYHLHMHVKGGRQLREPLLPLLWSRFVQVWRAA